MQIEVLTQTVHAALQQHDSKAFDEAIRGVAPVDLAEVLQRLPPVMARSMLEMLPAKQRARAVGYLRPYRQGLLLRGLPNEMLVELFTNMLADQRADLYNRLSEEGRLQLMPALAQAEREDIANLASYPKDSAGSIMSSSYIALRADQTVLEALDVIRHEAPDTETIYTVFVKNEAQQLIGITSLRDLILAHPTASVRDIMMHDFIMVYVHDDQEHAARLVARYDLLALPVVNERREMVGVITHDDAMDVAELESTEDIHRLGATVGATVSSLKDATIGALYRGRVLWLVLLVFGNIFSGIGIAHFEETIASVVSLVFFLPLLIGSGGNAGSQSSTLMVRALGTGDVVMRDWTRLLAKEIFVALLLGSTMAAAVSLLGFWRGGQELAMIVALSMIIIVLVGSTVGMLLPFVLNRLKLDPASASAPLVTSICDAAGVLIYLSIAKSILNL